MSAIEGEIGTARLSLDPSREREDLIAGLNFLRPVAITLGLEDLDALSPNVMGRSILRDHWFEIEGQLSRIQPHGLIDRLEDIATKIAFHPDTQLEQQLNPVGVEQGFQRWAEEYGVKDPLEHQRAVDEFRAQEEAEAREAAGNPIGSNWGVIDPTGTRW